MVFGREAAVVVKGRDGRTVLLQSRGLDVQQASLAASEAMATLQATAQASEPWDILSNTQAAPLLCGRVEVMHRKFAVTYRVAGGLVFLVVSAPTANVFSCVQLLGQVARVAMAPADGKAVEMTPERVQRRFGEASIYLAVDALMGSGGVLEANAALARAVGTLEQLHERDKGKGTPEAPKTPPQQQAGAARAARRTLQGAIDQLALLSFNAGAAMQGVQPRPGFQLPEVAQAASAAPRGLPGGPGGPQDPFAATPGGLGAPGASLDFGDDDFFNMGGKKEEAAATAPKPTLAPGADPNDPFAASEGAPGDWMSFDPAAAAKKDAAAAGAKMDAMGFEDNAFGDAAFAAPPPMVPSEPVLRLGEVWRGEVVGGRLARAGLTGRVEWVSEAAKSKVHTVQLLVQVPEPANEHLAAALTTARRHPACSRPGRVGGLLVADGILAKPHVGAPVLCYHLPSAACQPPMQVQLGASWQDGQDGRRLVTLGLHYSISRRVAPRTAGLEVEITVPALLEHPLRADPAGAVFDAKTRVLRWQQPGPIRALDNSGTAAQPFVASFLVGNAVADEAALTAALARLSARVVLQGADGAGSLSGAVLAQGVVDLELTPALCGWRAEMTAMP